MLGDVKLELINEDEQRIASSEAPSYWMFKGQKL
jgi:hypothetical protein